MHKEGSGQQSEKSAEIIILCRNKKRSISVLNGP